MILAVLLWTVTLSASSADTLANGADSAISDESVLYDSAEAGVVPLCTLDIATNPSGATVIADSVPMGVSPVTVVNVALGTHTLILQKAGYYQKKVVVTLSNPQRTAVNFDLSAPGTLAVGSIPDSAMVYINGVLKGVTPYRDSLVKPGTYQVRLEKAPYLSLIDSCVVTDRSETAITDTLRLSQAYQDSVAYVKEVAGIKKKRFTYGMIAGAFGLFLMVILAIEGVEK